MAMTSALHAEGEGSIPSILNYKYGYQKVIIGRFELFNA